MPLLRHLVEKMPFQHFERIRLAGYSKIRRKREMTQYYVVRGEVVWTPGRARLWGQRGGGGGNCHRGVLVRASPTQLPQRNLTRTKQPEIRIAQTHSTAAEVHTYLF